MNTNKARRLLLYQWIFRARTLCGKMRYDSSTENELGTQVAEVHRMSHATRDLGNHERLATTAAGANGNSH